jgi:hypothetical protein
MPIPPIEVLERPIRKPIKARSSANSKLIMKRV